MTEPTVPAGWLPRSLDAFTFARIELLFADGARVKWDTDGYEEWPDSGPLPVAWRPVDAPPGAAPDLDILRKGIV
jgi:hypothetical protein